MRRAFPRKRTERRTLGPLLENLEPRLLLSCSPDLDGSGAVDAARIEGVPAAFYSEQMLPANAPDEPVLNSDYVATNPTNGHVVLLVSWSLHDQIDGALDLYTAGLEADGFTVSRRYEGRDTPYASIKNHIKDEHVAHPDLSGAVFIGDFTKLPYAEVEWWNSDEGIWEYDSCITDYYFMDLDGTWLDTDGNGIFDDLVADGTQDPEIWVSRINPGLVGTEEAPVDEIELINRYFQKLHDYRTGDLTFTDRALLYVDDDWTHYGDDWDDHMLELYPGAVTVVDDKVGTNAADLKDRLDGHSYELLHNNAHASPGGYSYSKGLGEDGESIPGGTIHSSELPDLNWQVGFHTWFHCSFAKHTADGFGAGQYIFNTDYGLAGIGTTNAGGMNPNDVYYEALAEGATIGEAMMQWIDWWSADGFNTYEWDWRFGITCIGDGAAAPSYTPTNPGQADLRTVGNSVSDFNPKLVSPGWSWSCDWGVRNNGDAVSGPFEVDIYASTDLTIDPAEDFYLGTIEFGSLASGASATETLEIPYFPWSVPEAFYWVGADIDSGNNVLESDETNNHAFDDDSLLGVDFPPKADLVGGPDPYSNFSPDSVWYGDEWSCNWRINNVGDLAVTNNFAVKLYASTNQTIDPAYDRMLGAYTISEDIPAGGHIDTTLDVSSFSSSIPSGDYYIGIEIDIFDNIDESNEDNNIAVDLDDYPLTVKGQPKADLIIGPPEFSDFSPKQLEVGEAWTATCRVTNIGNAVAEDFYVSALASEDGVAENGNDYWITLNTVASLAPGESVDVTVACAAWPSHVDEGLYHVYFRADGNDQVDEFDEDNNTGFDDWFPLAVGTWPDLGAFGGPNMISSSQVVWRGEPWSVQSVIRNWGEEAVTDDFTIAYYMSEDTTFDPGRDHLIGSESYTATLPAKTSQVVSYSTDHFPYMPAGDYYLFVYVDSDELIAESNEANNSAYDHDGYPSTVMGNVPELAPRRGQYVTMSPQTVRPGEAWSAQWVVNNYGSAPATDFMVDYYASTDQTIDPATDYYIGSVLVDFCYPGLFAHANIAVDEFPAIPPGDYYLGMYADSGDKYLERDEENNFHATQDLYPLTVVWDGTGTIWGKKFNDLNQNGLVNAGEAGMSGWTIYLDQNRSGARDPEEPWTTTSGSGMYSFNNLPPGAYYVAEEQQLGWVQTAPRIADTYGEFLIDFDDHYAPRSFGETDALRDLYAPLGVHFPAYHPANPKDGGAILNENSGYNVSGYSSPNYLAFNGAPDLYFQGDGSPRCPQVIEFDNPVHRVKFNAATHNTSQTISVKAYDQDNWEVDSKLVQIDQTMSLIAVYSDQGIKRVVIDCAGTELFVIDDLRWEGGGPAGTAAVVLGAGETVPNRNFGNYYLGLPDLADAGSLSYVSPTTVEPGNSYFEAYCEIANNGPADAGYFDVTFYCSVDQVLDPAEDYLLGTETVYGINAYGVTGVEFYHYDFPAIPWDSYYVLADIDSGGAISESNEANNLVVNDTYPLVVPGPGMPDLMPLAGADPTISDNPAVVGLPWSASWDIYNDGDVAAGPFRVSFYLEDETEFDPPTADYLGSVDVTGLGSRGTQTVTLNLAAFPDIPIDDDGYYLAISVDDLNQVAEAKEYNNNELDQSLYPIYLDEPAPADLVAGHADASGFWPDVAIPGQYWSTWFKVENTGQAPSGDFTVSYYASLDETIDGGDHHLGDVRVSSIAGGGQDFPTLNINEFSETIPDDTYYVLLDIDSGDEVAESNESNNAAADDSVLTVGTIDLRQTGDAGSSFHPDSTWPGMPWSAQWEIINGGTVPANAFDVEFYACPTTEFDWMTAQWLGVVNLDGLPAGETATVDLEVEPFPLIAPGDYYVAVVIDSMWMIPETDKDNNTCFDLDDYPLTVHSGQAPAELLSPEYEVRMFGPQTVSHGDSWWADWGIANVGQTDAGPFNVTFYASEDETITMGDHPIGVVRMGGIPAGQTDIASLSLSSFPGSIPAGDFHVGVLIDSADEVAEYDEANNASADTSGMLLTVIAPTEFLGAHLFYNDSQHDGFDPLCGVSDELAMDPSVVPLLPGQTAGPTNYSAHSRGVDGVIVDIMSLNLPGELTVATVGNSFSFRAANGEEWPLAWGPVVNPTDVMVRAGSGLGGSDRIHLVWDESVAVRNAWLEVTARATSATGLLADEVFYFGNLPADANRDGVVDAADYMALKRAFGLDVPDPGGAADFDGSGRVDHGDLAAMGSNIGHSLNMAFTAPQVAGEAVMMAPAVASDSAAESDPADVLAITACLFHRHVAQVAEPTRTVVEGRCDLPPTRDMDSRARRLSPLAVPSGRLVRDDQCDAPLALTQPGWLGTSLDRSPAESLTIASVLDDGFPFDELGLGWIGSSILEPEA